MRPHAVSSAPSQPPKYARLKTYSSHAPTYPSMDESPILSIHSPILISLPSSLLSFKLHASSHYIKMYLLFPPTFQSILQASNL